MKGWSVCIDLFKLGIHSIQETLVLWAAWVGYVIGGTDQNGQRAPARATKIACKMVKYYALDRSEPIFC